MTILAHVGIFTSGQRTGRSNQRHWALYRYYRNTDKSHAFERETTVEAKPVTGSDTKVDTVTGTRETRISGDNVHDYRARVQRDGG